MGGADGLRTLVLGDLHYSHKNLEDHALLAAAVHRGIDAAAALWPPREPAGEPEPELDLVVCLGDELEHHNPPAHVRGACIRFLRSLAARARRLVVLVGNHTRRSNQVSTGPDHTLAEVAPGGNVTIVEDPQILELRGVRFAALPYIDPPAFQGVLQEHLPALVAGGEGLAFALGHQELHGATLRPGSESECGARWGAGWPPLISGHLHQRHTLGPALYVGTPMQHSLSETPEKYAYFGVLGGPTDPRAPPDGRWAHLPSPAPPPFGPREYVSTAGHLTEYAPPGIPSRLERRARPPELPALLAEVQLSNHYWRVRVPYTHPTEFLGSPSYSALAAHPRVRITTEHAPTAPSGAPSPPLPPSGERPSFYERLRAAAPTPLVAALLAHVAGK